MTSEPSPTPSGRTTRIGARHAVAAGHHLSAEAALGVLEAGGNAVDAGVAAGLVTGVVEVTMVNVAGVAPIMIRMAETGEIVTIDGLGTWPKAASCAYFHENFDGRIPDGLPRAVMPAAPDAWLTALERYGTMSFAEVSEAAIRAAREGFEVYPLIAGQIAEREETIRAMPDNAAVFLAGGRPPEAGETLVQVDLARTLQFLADQDKAGGKRGRENGLRAVREAFYEGDIARAIAEYHTENGGLITREDLAAFRVKVEAPLSIRLGDTEVYTCGPWCQGPMLLQVLNLLEGYDLAAMRDDMPAYIHTVTEAVKLAAADREAYYGDPKFIDVPMDTLLSKDYAAQRHEMIREGEAWPDMPAAGEIPGAAPSGAVGAAAPARGPDEGRWDTSYLCAVDKWGNAFSATPSDSAATSPMIPGTGLTPSTRGSQSWTDPDHPCSIEAGKRPRLTPNPALAIRPGQWVMPFGTPGGDVQTQAMAQVFLNIVVFGMDMQEAVAAPRFASASFPSSFEPHATNPGLLKLEASLAADFGDALAGLGHEILAWPEDFWEAGSVCAIFADQETGERRACADHRRAAHALAG
jgi:gamma-glutamyltranspeptidase/glutathione hydrolase